MTEYRDTHIHLNKDEIRKLKGIAADNDTTFKAVVNNALTTYTTAYNAASSTSTNYTVDTTNTGSATIIFSGCIPVTIMGAE